VNNWNEQHKLKKVELNLLYEMMDVLKNEEAQGEGSSGDIEFQKIQVENNKSSLASCEYLLNYFETNLPYSDSLEQHFVRAHSRYIGLAKDQAYQNAKNYGLGFIKNDSLKLLLVQTYETNTKWLLELNERNKLYEYNIEFPLLTELFDQITNRVEKSMIPLDYEGLKHNMKYLNVLRTTLNNRKEYLIFQERRYQRMIIIHELLKKEIASKAIKLIK